jgi:hypothetical protein
MTSESPKLTILAEQFRGALTRLELGDKRKRVIASHTEIRELLEGDALLNSWGVGTVLIGSYARETAIYPGKDVDVFAKMTMLDTTVSPRTLYEGVEAVLVKEYGDRAKPRARSINVAFPMDGDTDFSVDVVPAVRYGRRWAIPRHDTMRWDAPDTKDRWVETDPEKLTELTMEMNGTLKVDGQGAYVPVVKLVRQTRKHHREEGKPGGFYFEVMTYWAFKAGIGGGSFAEVFAATLRSIATQLTSSAPVMDPVLGREYRPVPDRQDLAAAAAAFSQLAAKAERALVLNRCPAAVVWRDILGRNDRGPCFPLPPGCDEKGSEIKDVAAVAAVGSKEASGFA